MNAPLKVQEVEVRIGEARVIVPGEIAAMAYLEKMLDESRPLSLAVASTTRNVPTIGEPWKDGIYGGITIFQNMPHDLELLPGEREPGCHQDAEKWAEEAQKAMLPSRFDNLVLFTNLKDRFKTDYAYWCKELPAGNASYAWCQGFDYGYQGWGNRDDRCRAVAVRRYQFQ